MSKTLSEAAYCGKKHVAFGTKIPPFFGQRTPGADPPVREMPGVRFRLLAYSLSDGRRDNNGDLNESVIRRIGLLSPKGDVLCDGAFTPENLMAILKGEFSQPDADECWLLQTVLVQADSMIWRFLDWKCPERQALLELQNGDYWGLEFGFTVPLVKSVALETTYDVTMYRRQEFWAPFGIKCLGKTQDHYHVAVTRSDEVSWDTEIL